MKLREGLPFMLSNEAMVGEEIEAWREDYSNTLRQSSQVTIRCGAFPDGSGVWLRITRFEPEPSTLPLEGLGKVKRYILSATGWRQYHAGETFDLQTDIYRMPADDIIALAREILAMAEIDAEGE